MPRYIEIDEKRLSGLHDGLELLESLDRDAVNALDLHIYGITTNAQIVDAAKEAIADSEELQEQDIQLSEVAVAIQISADTIYALLGSGIKLHRDDFAYMGSGGEGVRTLNFVFASYKPTAALSYFTKIAIASSDSWLDDFLKKYGSATPAQVTPAVHRTSEATQPGVPPAPETPAPAATSTAIGGPGRTDSNQSKMTSLEGGLKLAAFLDEFLS